MSTPSKSPVVTPRGTPNPAANDISQGSEELHRFLVSKKGILILIVVTVLCVLGSVLTNKFFGNKATSIYLGVIFCLGFAARHFIGNKKDKND